MVAVVNKTTATQILPLQEYRTAGSKKEDQSSGVLQELNNKELCCRQEKERDRAMNYTAYSHLLIF